MCVSETGQLRHFVPTMLLPEVGVRSWVTDCFRHRREVPRLSPSRPAHFCVGLSNHAVNGIRTILSSSEMTGLLQSIGAQGALNDYRPTGLPIHLIYGHSCVRCGRICHETWFIMSKLGFTHTHKIKIETGTNLEISVYSKTTKSKATAS